VCQDQHRRIVLAILTEEKRSLTLDELTQAILKYNHQTSITEASEDVMAEIRRSLHHVHLPKLAADGLITNYPARQFVEPTEQFEQVQPILSPIIAADPTLEAPIER